MGVEIDNLKKDIRKPVIKKSVFDIHVDIQSMKIRLNGYKVKLAALKDETLADSDGFPENNPTVSTIDSDTSEIANLLNIWN